jgi:hypothetical protein
MDAAAKRGRRRRKVHVSVPDSLAPAVVTLSEKSVPPPIVPERLHVAEPQPAGCIFESVLPTSTATARPSTVIAKYSVTGDADSTDSVTFAGGPVISDFRLVPIFNGTAWLTSTPALSDVMEAIRALLGSPYVSELDQYGLTSLRLDLPVLVTGTPAASHTSADVGTVAWRLIDAGLVAPPGGGASAAEIYMVFYPSGTSVAGIAACGWHFRYADLGPARTGGDAWVGGVEFPTGTGTTSALANITRIFSHELVEMITDPSGAGGWVMDRTLNRGTEIGDACNNTVDFTAGEMVNAYWSERHKACIIPKPRGTAWVDSTVETITETVMSSGTVTIHGDPLDIRTCLDGTYSWTSSFVPRRARFFAHSSNFQSPTFTWRVMDAQGGPRDVADGFSGTVWLDVDTWVDDVNGTVHTRQLVPVDVSVATTEMTVVANSAGDALNFSVLVEVTVTEGAVTATALGRQAMTCQVFAFDEAYMDALDACRKRLDKLILETIELIPPRDPGDPAQIWVDTVSERIGGERRVLAVRAASAAAAIEATQPVVALQLMALASLVCQVPTTVLAATQAATAE